MNRFRHAAASSLLVFSLLTGCGETPAPTPPVAARPLAPASQDSAVASATTAVSAQPLVKGPFQETLGESHLRPAPTEDTRQALKQFNERLLTELELGAEGENPPAAPVSQPGGQP